MKNSILFKKTILFKVIILLLLFGKSSLNAQQIITQSASGTLHKNVKYKQDFNERIYAKVWDENDKKVFLKNQSTINITPSENATNDLVLTINLAFDEGEFSPPSWVIIYNESGYIQHVMREGTNSMVVDVPAGTYEIMAEFVHVSGKSYYIINEQNTLQQNTTIEMNPDDAVNYIAIETYDETGQVLKPGIENPSTSFLSTILFNRVLNFNPNNFTILGSSYTWDRPFDVGQDPVWNFYINDLSDRYSFMQSLIGFGYEQGDYFTKYETITGIEASVSLENNPENWTSHREKFQPSLLGANDVFKAFSTTNAFNGYSYGGWTVAYSAPYSEEVGFKCFLNNAFNDNPADLLVTPAIVDHFAIIDPNWGEESILIKGSPVVADGNGGVVYGSGDGGFNQLFLLPLLGMDFYNLEDLTNKILPFHPRFSFDNTTTTFVEQGNNVPITITGFKVLPNEINFFKTSNKGRYGENRESDFFATQIEAKQNGSVVFSGAYLDFINFDLPTNGQIEIKLTNTNTLIYGIEGKNITTISYNANEEDAPPTLQHLQFRNANDQVTSVFESTEGSTVRLSAGDFRNTMIDDWSEYYAYEEGNNVEVYYGIYNQNDWMELQLIEYPEYFQMPAFGDYYEASLDGIENEDNDVWYDLKVICTDATGNKQEQVISPAFKINNTLGIDDIIESDFSVYPNPFSEQLNVILPESVNGNYTFKVIDLTGRIIYTKNQSDKSFTWDSSFLSGGVYILSIESNGKSIAKKVIKI